MALLVTSESIISCCRTRPACPNRLHHPISSVAPSNLRISHLAGRQRRRTTSQHSQLEDCVSTAGSAHDATDCSSTSYTSMRADPLGFWDSHQGLNVHIAAPRNQLSSFSDEESIFLAAELQLLKSAALDRAEMHSILAQQRDNWSKLFQRMLTATSMTACLLSGLAGSQGAHMSLSLNLPALLLNAGTAAMMAIINKFQPSQLAEEQRTAARLFRKVASDIQYALSVSPHLRQHTPSFLRDCKRRVQALDKAFPMPLTPGGLEKFPSTVVPTVLIEPLLDNQDSIHGIDIAGKINGWDKQLTQDLRNVASLVRSSDIPKYTGWAQNLVKVNKSLAIAAPFFVAAAAVLNALVISTLSALPTVHIQLDMWAAVCSVLAAFAGTLSNDMQLGMVFELYRNSAGYYADVETSIKEMLNTPIEHRENGELFRQRIAYQLGREAAPSCPCSTTSDITSGTPLVPVGAKEAGTLF